MSERLEWVKRRFKADFPGITEDPDVRFLIEQAEKAQDSEQECERLRQEWEDMRGAAMQAEADRAEAVRERDEARQLFLEAEGRASQEFSTVLTLQAKLDAARVAEGEMELVLESTEFKLAAARDAVGALREALEDVDNLIQATPPGDCLPDGPLTVYDSMRKALTATAPAAAEWRARVWREGWSAGRDAAAKAVLLLPGDMASMIGRQRAIDAIEALEPPEAPEEP